MNNKVFGIVIGIIIVGALGAALFLGDKDKLDSPDNLSKEEVLQINDQDHVRGNPDSKVTLIEYGDFQCPFCGAVFPIADATYNQYKDRVRFVFRHFPIVSAHPNAMVAHRAAEAAGKQGKFYEMHDLLYQRQQIWSQGSDAAGIIHSFAEELGLDIAQYDADFAASTTLDSINAQLKAAETIEVTGTPTFFVNDQKLDRTPSSPEELGALLDTALAEQN